LPFTSRTVTVMVEVVEPLATTFVLGDAVAVDNAPLRLFGSPTNATVGCCATTTWLAPGSTMTVIVLVSAVVEATVPVATPLAFVMPGCTSVLLLPEEASCTAWAATGLPFTSRTVTVIVDVVEPFATTFVLGDAVAVDRAALRLFGSPAKTTAGCCVMTTWPGPGLTVAVIVLVSAVVDAMVPVATPPASVTPGCTRVLLLPDEANCTVWPATGLPFVLRTVTVIVEVATPSAISASGDAAAVDKLGLMFSAPSTNSTVGCCASSMVWEPCKTATVIILVSAVVDAIVPVVVPLASVSAGCTIVLFEPVAVSTTVRPAIGLPFARRITTVIVEVSMPLARTPLCGAAVTVDWLGEAVTPVVSVILEPHPPSAVSTRQAARRRRVQHHPLIATPDMSVPFGDEQCRLYPRA
jgi:hypothetical protein